MDDFLKRVVEQREREQDTERAKRIATGQPNDPLTATLLPTEKFRPGRVIKPPRVGPRGGRVTRYLKSCCKTCGYTVRCARKWLDAHGPPLCPNVACKKVAMEREPEVDGMETDNE